MNLFLLHILPCCLSLVYVYEHAGVLTKLKDGDGDGALPCHPLPCQNTVRIILMRHTCITQPRRSLPSLTSAAQGIAEPLALANLRSESGDWTGRHDLLQIRVCPGAGHGRARLASWEWWVVWLLEEGGGCVHCGCE